jgi:uncharacterized protein
MLLDLTRYRQPCTHLDLSCAPADVQQDGDSYEIVAPVDLTLDVHKDKEAFRLQGRVGTTLGLSCSRCLEPYRMTVDSPVDVRYLPASAIPADDEREIAGEDLETGVYHDNRIDLGELIREQLYLMLPMKPLCLDACRGLCARCGANLNQGACGCPAGWTDPRPMPFRVLKDNQA